MPKINILPEDRFTRTLFGIIMTTAVLYSWGKWVTFALGVLLLVSAAQGFCLSCYLHKKFRRKDRK